MQWLLDAGRDFKNMLIMFTFRPVQSGMTFRAAAVIMLSVLEDLEDLEDRRGESLKAKQDRGRNDKGRF